MTRHAMMRTTFREGAFLVLILVIGLGRWLEKRTDWEADAAQWARMDSLSVRMVQNTTLSRATTNLMVRAVPSALASEHATSHLAQAAMRQQLESTQRELDQTKAQIATMKKDYDTQLKNERAKTAALQRRLGMVK